MEKTISKCIKKSVVTKWVFTYEIKPVVVDSTSQTIFKVSNFNKQLKGWNLHEKISSCILYLHFIIAAVNSNEY